MKEITDLIAECVSRGAKVVAFGDKGSGIYDGIMTRFPDFQTMEFTMKTVDFSTGENKLDYYYTNF